MKAITIQVSEPIYRKFQEVARREDRTAAELIRESMTLYLRDRPACGTSVLELAPLSLGRVKRPLTRRTDLLGGMLHKPGVAQAIASPWPARLADDRRRSSAPRK